MKKMLLALIATLVLTENTPAVASSGPAVAVPSALKSGLRIKPPYYMEKDGKPVGIDAEIGEAIVKQMNKDATITYGEKGNWEVMLDQLKAGAIDFMGDATVKEAKEGDVFAFSKTYRQLNYKILSKKGAPKAFATVKAFSDFVKANKATVKVGYVDTVNYSANEPESPDTMMKLFQEPGVKFEKPMSFIEVLELMFAGKVDYAVIDEMHARCVMDQRGNADQFEITDIGLSADRQFMFNKKIDINEVNKAIDALKANGKINEIVNKTGRCAAAPAK